VIRGEPCCTAPAGHSSDERAAPAPYENTLRLFEIFEVFEVFEVQSFFTAKTDKYG
jgi:hypothetical protein